MRNLNSEIDMVDLVESGRVFQSLIVDGKQMSFDVIRDLFEFVECCRCLLNCGGICRGLWGMWKGEEIILGRPQVPCWKQ